MPRHHLHSAFVSLLVLLGLSACTSTEPMGGLFGGGGGGDKSEPAAQEAEQEVAAIRRGTPPAPNSLLNQDKDHLLTALGQPTLLREELESQMWQYSGQSCAFFLYLYPDSAGTFRVTHVEARANQGGSLDPQACLEAQWGKKAKS